MSHLINPDSSNKLKLSFYLQLISLYLSYFYMCKYFCLFYKISHMSFKVQFSKGVDLVERGEITEGLSHFQTMCREYPLNISCKFNYATLLFQSHLISEAKASFSQILNFQPFNYMCFYNLFLCAQAEKELESGVSYLQRALSCLYAEKGKKANNIELLQKAISYCPDNLMAHVGIALAWEKRGKLDQAEENFANAIVLRSESSYPYIQRASFYWRNDKLSETEKDLRKYHQLKNKSSSLMPEYKQSQKTQPQLLQRINQLSKQFEILSKLEIPEEQVKKSEKQSHNKEAKNTEEAMEDSQKNISEEIEQLEKEIKQEVGNILTPESSLEQEGTFLSAQIEKVAEDIEKQKKIAEMIEHDEGSSISSKLTEINIINETVFSSHSKFKFELVSSQMFENENYKGGEEAKVVIYYGDKRVETEARNDLIWRKKMEFPVIPNYKTIELELEVKPKIFWSSKKVIGVGKINLLETGETKCILNNGEFNCGIIYYKMKLIR